MATARVERRLSAILAADVVGYRRLMERDEAGTFERLKRKRGIVALDQALTAGFQFHGSSSAMRLAG
jgi:class 3 adenylate cyclase